MLDGRFFHRLEVNNTAESENVKNMKSAIAEYYRNGNRVRPQGLTMGDGEDVWQKCNVAKTSFYDALKWERDHPAKKWDGDRIRQRGKISLLTYDMESELLHWIAISHKHSGLTLAVTRFSTYLRSKLPLLVNSVHQHPPFYFQDLD